MKIPIALFPVSPFLQTSLESLIYSFKNINIIAGLPVLGHGLGPDPRFILPIPQREINNANLTQNAYYR
ncbi:hypothetical protein [Hymenobacter ruricola]|uniref:Uncharacterized protein n=1 Tax=Hymenobacter ruricola TaxID=2791023 RepID=A0ABS0HZ97_9BACT|nr:hypothetical protein [Hymenobacter ruricola]MBF9220032.1 hypothetical protein [Hymenobacter ruricola]